MNQRKLGFTLIELLIAIAIVGILAALAIPAYQKNVQRSRRADAVTALTQVAAAEEKYYFTNNKYSDETTVGYGPTSPEKYYTISVSNPDDQTFVATATATGAQASDTACATMKLDNAGTRTPDVDHDTAACWHR